MKDLDFDELDKAVNSLLSTKDEKPAGVPPSAPAAPPPVTSVPVTDEAKPAAFKVPERTPAAAPSQEMPEEPPKQNSRPTGPLVAQRSTLAISPSRKNTFIDVVNPATKKASSPARSAPKLEPLHSDIASSVEPKPTEPTPDLTDANELKPTVPEPKTDEKRTEKSDAPAPATAPTVEPNSIGHTEWPDPLEFHGFKDELVDDDKLVKVANEKAQEHDEKSKPEAETAEAKDDKKPEEPPETEPNSPFLRAVKVEKRPLGAFSDEDKAKVAESPPETAKTDETAKDKPKETNADDEPKLPGEGDIKSVPGALLAAEQPVSSTLTNELVAVESGEAAGNFEVHDVVGDTSDKPEKASDKKDSKDKEPELLLPSQSIPPQYHSTEKPIDHDKRPVFDTKEYHPPLRTGEGHHRSKVGTAVTILLIILLLAALGIAGYLAYLFYA